MFNFQLKKGLTPFSEVIQAMWNDFNNPKVFSKEKDILALITGPLSASDTRNVQWLLNQSRHAKNVDEFFSNVTCPYFSPPKSEEKLGAFKHHLKRANKNKPVPQKELFSFIRHFHWLGYDLGKEVGVVLSLIHSHISQFNADSSHFIWTSIVDFVHSWSQDGGTITRDNLPKELKDAFKIQLATQIPSNFVEKIALSERIELKQTTHQSDLAIANLIGSWDEDSENDIRAISEHMPIQFNDWIKKMREILNG